MPVSMTDSQQVVLTASETDASGNSVTPGTLTWTSDTAVVTLTPSADTLSCTAAAAGLGTANVTVSDSAAGVTSDPEVITVAAGAATSISISAGTPESITPAA